ncbi:MAG: hypothetical protein M3Q07_08925, partial [Pseudobdellovibrionaceae bacterium]|nr:hypothetical protein [Pseudobdellovibrionaceae bacterium]
MDDLQWADRQSLQVLAVLGTKIINNDAPCTMLMGTYRSDEIPHDHPLVPSFLEMRHQFDLIELGPLRESDANALVECLLEEKSDEVALLQNVCYRFTAGNPFFIYEYLKSAIQTGVFALEENTQLWKFHQERIHASDLSNGVASLVAERIRTLNVFQRSLISMASVAGHSMQRSHLKALLPVLMRLRPELEEVLTLLDLEQTIELCYQELLQKNMLVPDASRFAFFHDKIQESSYRLLTAEEKGILHFEFGMLCVESAQAGMNDAAIFEAAYHICQGHRTDLTPNLRKFLFVAAQCARKVFAFDRAKEYLQVLLNAIVSQPEIDSKEKFDALELMADTLSVSDQIAHAMEIYDNLLTFDCEPIRRARIYAKKVEFCMNLFDYKSARQACEAGLKLLGRRIFTTELSSYLYIAVSLPFLVLYCLYFKFFGRQSKVVESEAEEIRFQLLLKTAVSQYFTQPIVAIANFIPLTFELLSYKDCNHRASMICYWGIIISAFGVKDFANVCFQRAYEYFDKTARPVDKGFALFCWGFISDMPRGDLQSARKKIEEAVFTLAPVG